MQGCWHDYCGPTPLAALLSPLFSVLPFILRKGSSFYMRFLTVRAASGVLAASVLTAGLTLAPSFSNPANAQTGVSKTDSTSGYFDASGGTREFVVSAADMLAGASVSLVTIDIDFEKFDGQTMGVNPGGTPFYNEIEFILTNPAGASTTLIAANSFSSGTTGFRGVITFADDATTVVNADVNTLLAGYYRPTGPGSMGNLNLASGLGTWVLGIRDTQGSDHLGYYSATLNLNGGSATAAVPEPGTLTLALLAGATAAAGLVTRRRRDRRANGALAQG